MDRRSALLLLTVTALSACEEQRKRQSDADDDVAPKRRASASAVPPVQPFKFGTDLEAGIALARRDKRPLIVFFSAEWNGPCKELQRVFATPEFRKAAAGFVGVLVDVTNDEEPAQKAKLDHRIRGVPAVLVADSTGREVHRVESLEPLADWLERLATVK